MEPIFGYLKLAEKLVLNGDKYSESWNFGPTEDNFRKVSYVIRSLNKLAKCSFFKTVNIKQPHESKILKIDSSKARSRLNWKNYLDLETALNKTFEWYDFWLNKKNMYNISIDQINFFQKKIKSK